MKLGLSFLLGLCGGLAHSQTYWNPDSTGYNYLSRGANLSQWLPAAGTTVERDGSAIKWTIPPNSGAATLELRLVDVDLSDRVIYTTCRRNNHAAKIETRLIITSGKGFLLAVPVDHNENGNHLPVDRWHHLGQTAWLSPFGGAARPDLRHVSKLQFRAENAAVEQILWIAEIKYAKPRGPACIIHFNHYRDSADLLLTPWLIARGYPANIDFTYEYAKNEFAHVRANGNFWVRYIGLARIRSLVEQYGWSVTHHGVFYEDLTKLTKEERMKLYSLEPFLQAGFNPRGCLAIPMDQSSPAIRAEIDSLKLFHAIRDQWAKLPNELPIDNPARLRFYRVTSASAGPNLRGQPETLAQMRSRVDNAFSRKGLLIFNIESIVTAPAPNHYGTVELSLLSDDQALIEYADSLGFTFLTFKNLFEPDPNYQQQLSINHDYPLARSGVADTLRVLQNDLFPAQGRSRLAAVSSPKNGQATMTSAQRAIIYRSKTDYIGADRFYYVATNGILSDTAWVFLSVVSSNVSAVDDRDVPQQVSLLQNYPNPFNPSTTISFSTPRPVRVTLKVYNLSGREVASLLNEVLEPGTHEVKFDAAPLTSGVYFAVLKTGEETQVRRLLFMK